MTEETRVRGQKNRCRVSGDRGQLNSADLSRNPKTNFSLPRRGGLIAD